MTLKKLHTNIAANWGKHNLPFDLSSPSISRPLSYSLPLPFSFSFPSGLLDPLFSFSSRYRRMPPRRTLAIVANICLSLFLLELPSQDTRRETHPNPLHDYSIARNKPKPKPRGEERLFLRTPLQPQARSSFDLFLVRFQKEMVSLSLSSYLSNFIFVNSALSCSHS